MKLKKLSSDDAFHNGWPYLLEYSVSTEGAFHSASPQLQFAGHHFSATPHTLVVGSVRTFLGQYLSPLSL